MTCGSPVRKAGTSALCMVDASTAYPCDPLVIRTGREAGAGKQPAGDHAHPKGEGLSWGVTRCSAFKRGMGGDFIPSIQAQLAAEPFLARTIQGEADRNAGTVPGPTASLRCWRKVLSSQAGCFLPVLPNGIGLPKQAPRWALSPASAGPSSLRMWDPPWDQEKERGPGRRRASSCWNPAVCWLCDPGPVTAHSGPQFPYVMENG